MILEIELPDGRVAEVEVPDGMDVNQAAQEVEQMYQANPQAFGGTAPAQQEAPAEQPGMLQQAASAVESAASQYFPPYGVVKGMFGEGQTGGGMENYGRGVASGLGSAVRGVRQGWNALTGDDAELAQLNQQEAASRQQLEQDTGGGFMAGAGRMVGQVAPAIAAAGAMPQISIPGALGVAARVGAGAAGGALGAGAGALTPEEEQSGDRAQNMTAGAIIGGAVPAVTSAGSRLINSLRKVAPEEAIDDFAAQALGARPGEAGQAYAAVRGAAEAEKGARMGRANELYRAIEQAADEPVTMANTSRLSQEALDLPDTVRARLSSTFRNALEGARAGSTRVSPIVDKTGRPIRDAKAVSFKDVRETIRELRKAQRGMPYTDQGQAQVQRLDLIIDTLQNDLDDWAARGAKNADVLNMARRADAAYSKEVAPFMRKESPIGGMLRGTGGERDIDRLFLRRNTGEAVQELTEKVPEARDPLRQLYGQQLRAASVKGPTSVRGALEGGTTGEKLLTRKEADYLREVSKSIGESPNTQSSFSPTLEGLFRRLGADRINKMVGGSFKYNQQPSGQRGALADFLRAYAAGQTIEE